MIEMSPYWMVHGGGPTNYRHDTRASAVEEAERLARSNPGRVFVVLEAVEAIRKVDVERVDLRAPDKRASGWPATPDDIPF